MKRNISDKKHKFLFFSLLFIFCVSMGSILFFIYEYLMHYDMVWDNNPHDRVIEIDKALVKSSDGSRATFNLPHKFSDENKYSYEFIAERTNPHEDLYVKIKGAYLKFTMSSENNLIYEHKPYDTTFFKSGGDFLRFIRIPDKYIGKTIQLEFESAIESSYGVRIPNIFLGTHSDLILYGNEEDYLLFFISFILIAYSLESLMMLGFLTIYKKATFKMLLVSLYSLSIGFYIIVRSPIVYMYLYRGAFSYYLEYVSMLFLPIPLLLFLVDMFNSDKKSLIYKSLLVLSFISIANLITQLFLNIFSIKEFIEMQKISQGIFILAFVLAFFVPFAMKFKEQLKKSYIFSVLLLNATLSVSLLFYMITDSVESMIFVGIGSLIFVGFQASILIRLYTDIYKENYLSVFNKKLAFIDNLTRLYNRNAFEREISRLDEIEYDKLAIIIIDINDLKLINDNYGHNSGDIAIKLMAEIIKKTIDKYKKIKSFRMGGDEFLMLGYDFDKWKLEEVKRYMDEVSEEIMQKNNDFSFDFAIGYGVYYHGGQEDIFDFIAKVDRKMYQDKVIRKNKMKSNPY